MAVAWLGTGLMGAAFVRALLAKKQVKVHVWNRSLEKAKVNHATRASFMELFFFFLRIFSFLVLGVILGLA